MIGICHDHATGLAIYQVASMGDPYFFFFSYGICLNGSVCMVLGAQLKVKLCAGSACFLFCWERSS